MADIFIKKICREGILYT